MGIEAAVDPHRELSPGPAVAHPPHRLTQEVGGAASGVGSALVQPRHQYVAGSGPSRPGPGQQLPADPIQLAGMAPPEAAQERPQSLPSRKRGGGWRLDHAAESAGRPAGAQHVGVVNAVATSQTLPPRKRGAEATSVTILSPVLAWPGARPKFRCRSTSCGRPRCKANVAGRSSPAL